MTYPCGIIRDLLPLYIDDVCNKESRDAVEKHLAECEKCRNDYEVMKNTGDFGEQKKDSLEDIKMENSLKNVKNRINKKIRNIILVAITVVIVFTSGFYLLFEASIKEVSAKDISVSAKVYSLESQRKIPEGEVTDSESVTIFSDEEDNSEIVNVKIPEIGNINLTKNTIEKCGHATVVSFSSEYFLRNIEMETRDNTIYITGFKTTLFGNRAENYQKQTCMLEFQEINKIVFVDDKGMETVLWSR